jgi:hypothetical protein
MRLGTALYWLQPPLTWHPADHCRPKPIGARKRTLNPHHGASDIGKFLIEAAKRSPDRIVIEGNIDIETFAVG